MITSPGTKESEQNSTGVTLPTAQSPSKQLSNMNFSPFSNLFNYKIRI